MKRIYPKLIAFLDSNLFLWLVIALFALQALWVAFSFRYPLPYDEDFHFGLIKIYSHRLSPIITNQPTGYDFYRDLFHEGSYLYHYIMSFPYRLIVLFTNVQAKQVLALRVLNIALFGSGLLLFSRLFRKLGVKQYVINVALLLLVLLPMTSLVAATINYDNMLFPLTAIFLGYCVQVILAKEIDWKAYAGVVISGCAASLVQVEFLPVFAIAVVYLTIVSWRRYGKKFFSKFTTAIKKSHWLTVSIAATLFVIFFSLFAQVYVTDTIRYGTPNPDCGVTMQKSRCMKSPVYSSYQTLLASKDQRSMVSAPHYAHIWLEAMVAFATWSMAVNTSGKPIQSGPLPLVRLMVFAGLLGGIAILLYAWRYMPKSDASYFLMTIAAGLTAAVFIQNIAVYHKYHVAATIQARYLLPVLPILMVYIALAVNFVLRRLYWLKLASLTFVTVAFLQAGGGVSTHILLSQDNWYWQQPAVIRMNHAAQRVLRHLVVQE